SFYFFFSIFTSIFFFNYLFIFIFFFFFFFFFKDPAPTEIYTLSLHDALPISRRPPFTRVVIRSSRLSSAWTTTDRLGPTRIATTLLPARSTLVKAGSSRVCAAAMPDPRAAPGCEDREKTPRSASTT